MDNTIMYPRACRDSIRRIRDELGIDVEMAYAMILVTAALMDLYPGDDEVLRIILKDNGVEDPAIA